jgi:hypothetical protein
MIQELRPYAATIFTTITISDDNPGDPPHISIPPLYLNNIETLTITSSHQRSTNPSYLVSQLPKFQTIFFPAYNIRLEVLFDHDFLGTRAGDEQFAYKILES